MIKICVSGSNGRMGSSIIELARGDAGFEVVSAFDIGGDAEGAIAPCDCLIEFTSPQATIEHLAICVKKKKAMIIGTTGLSDDERKQIVEAAGSIPVVYSPNMSIGVNLLFKLASDAAKVLGSEYDVNIVEAHHVHKKDAPSGTAKELARIIKEAQGGDDEIQIDSVREGEIVGEHTITFESQGDLIEITHSAKTRDILAKGALQAAKWIAGKTAGLYSMKDVLGL